MNLGLGLGLNRFSSGGAGSTILVLDNMVEASNTVLTLHNPDIDVEGGGWFKTLTNDALVVASAGYAQGAGAAVLGIDTGVSDHVTTGIMERSGASTTPFWGICVRLTDLNNYIIAQMFEFTHFKLIRNTAGTHTELDSVVFAHTPDTQYTIEITCDGTSISATVDGGNTVSATESQGLTNTNVGFRNRFSNDRIHFLECVS